MLEVLARSVGQPKKRLSHVYDLCRTRRICEGGDTLDNKFATGTEEDGEEKVSEKLYVDHGNWDRGINWRWEILISDERGCGKSEILEFRMNCKESSSSGKKI